MEKRRALVIYSLNPVNINLMNSIFYTANSMIKIKINPFMRPFTLARQAILLGEFPLILSFCFDMRFSPDDFSFQR